MNKLLYFNEFIKRITNIDEIGEIAKLTAFMCRKLFDCDNKVSVLLSFGLKDLTQEAQDYLESFLNIVKLKLKYLFSFKELKNSLQSTKAALASSLTILSNLAEIRDFCTKGHMQRVSVYSRNIALNLKLEDDDVETIIFDALTTDRLYRKAMQAKEAIELMFREFIGKIDEEILRKSTEVLLESKSVVSGYRTLF
jgi:HD-GYP domain-containing protein (c-di-GMP phosphodiesterase class II)